MIKAIIFDLDGTLVQTEILKAHSYGKAIEQMSNGSVNEGEVVNAFKEFVGLSRNEVTEKLVEKYYPVINTKTASDKNKVVENLINLRLNIYDKMLSDPAVLPKYCCSFNIKLLKTARERGYKTGLATMSHCSQVEKVLRIMKIDDQFNFKITIDEINNAKPDPEIYLRMLHKLEINKDQAIIIEDSVTGIKAAQAAGIDVFAVTNSLTKDKVNKSGLLDEKFIINDPVELNERVFSFINNGIN